MPPTPRRRPRLLRSFQRPDRVGALLVLFGLFYLVYSYSLTGPRPTPRLKDATEFVQKIAPLSTWAILWAGAGVVCLVAAFTVRRRPPGAAGFAAAEIPPLLWGLGYLAAWGFDGIPRAWVSGLIFLLFAAFAYVLAGLVDPGPIARPIAPSAIVEDAHDDATREDHARNLT